MTTPRARFRPHERVNDPRVFRKAFDLKRSASDGALILYGVENGLDHARLGISVGRRRVRHAVDRNRVKRLIRETFRLTKGEFHAGVDYIVVPKNAAITFMQVRAGFPALARAVGRRLGLPPVQVTT